MNLYIDIETRPSRTLPSLEDIKVDGRLKDPEKILKALEEGQLEQWHKEALDSKKGEILCICLGVDFMGDYGTSIFSQTYNNDTSDSLYWDERDIMVDFDHYLSDHQHHDINWIGHNIKGFDLPWLYQKALKYRCKNILRKLPTQRYAKNIFDTMEMWNPWDYRSYIKLQELAEYFGMSGKSLTLEEQKAIWLNPTNEGYKKIVDYCANDVKITRDIYKLMQ